MDSRPDNRHPQVSHTITVSPKHNLDEIMSCKVLYCFVFVKKLIFVLSDVLRALETFALSPAYKKGCGKWKK